MKEKQITYETLNPNEDRGRIWGEPCPSVNELLYGPRAAYSLCEILGGPAPATSPGLSSLCLAGLRKSQAIDAIIEAYRRDKPDLVLGTQTTDYEGISELRLWTGFPDAGSQVSKGYVETSQGLWWLEFKSPDHVFLSKIRERLGIKMLKEPCVTVSDIDLDVYSDRGLVIGKSRGRPLFHIRDENADFGGWDIERIVYQQDDRRVRETEPTKSIPAQGEQNG